MSQKKIALITGITGQDGAYLAEMLLQKGYEVHGVIRRVSWNNQYRLETLGLLEHLNKNLFLHYGDMQDAMRLYHITAQVQPDEVYNLAAQSDVAISFEMPDYTFAVNAQGTQRLLQSAEDVARRKQVRYYQASTSEIFGQTTTTPQDETTPFAPCSPYGISKLAAYWMTVNSRKTNGLHASNGILFNHESPIRGERFVTRKITLAVNKIAAGTQSCLYLGNLDACRDWGHAKDYVRGMWQMLQQDTPDDYILATGKSYSVRELIEFAFDYVGISIAWEGKGVEEKAINVRSGDVVVQVDPAFFRNLDIQLLRGNAARAKKMLGWEPSISFHDMIEEMMRFDHAALQKAA